jgi:tRNA(Ile)-lysidine synthase TilS/MesJ
MSWITKRCFRLVHKSLGSNRLIADGERVVVGVSGGADSLCLLHLLESLSRTGRRGWDLRAVHVDPGFDEWNSARVVKACGSIGVACTVVRVDVPACVKRTGHDSCYTCARERRKALFLFCEKLGSRKLALAHNLDDVNETFLMNLLYTSSAPHHPAVTAAVRRQARHRPAALLRKQGPGPALPERRRHPGGAQPVHIRALEFARNRAEAPQASLCRRPRIRTNLFAGLHNLKPEYLPVPKRTGS